MTRFGASIFTLGCDLIAGPPPIIPPLPPTERFAEIVRRFEAMETPEEIEAALWAIQHGERL